jgi:hypothetical protein
VFLIALPCFMCFEVMFHGLLIVCSYVSYKYFTYFLYHGLYISWNVVISIIRVLYVFIYENILNEIKVC